MKYSNVLKATFINRPNRFIANVDIDGKTETVHVKNTGRCKELLLPGAEVYLAVSDNSQRKTKYDIIAVKKERGALSPLLINMDSQAVNDAVWEWLPKSGLFSENAVIRREVTHGNSRFDFYIQDGRNEAFFEVKGVTLEFDGVAMFPDSPTQRGVKHINELISCVSDGYQGYIMFVIQMKGIHLFKPNDITHKAFGDALRLAENKGVKIIAMDCDVTQSTMDINKPVSVEI